VSQAVVSFAKPMTLLDIYSGSMAKIAAAGRKRAHGHIQPIG
jgi:hypothetical protein